MRICHITSGDLWAGAEVMCYQLLKSLLKISNIEITLILLNEGKLAEEVRKLGIPVTVVNETQYNFFQIAKKIRKIILHTSPDIIHSHRLKENILAYLCAKSDKNTHLVCTQHGMPEPKKLKYKVFQNAILSKYHYYILSKYFRHVIVVSEELQTNIINSSFLEKDKVILIHNGVEIPDNYYLNRDNDVFIIGSAGRLDKVKDYPLMVEIASEIIKKNDNIKFKLAGEGPEKENILEMIRKHKLEKEFILTGFIDNIATFYQSLSLYINTSLHEGLPMSILEAMAHGIPVIAINRGGLPEIVNDGFQGYLVDDRNPKMFAEKCLQLYNNKELIRKMGTESREKIINSFSVDKMAEKYHNLYCKILKYN